MAAPMANELRWVPWTPRLACRLPNPAQLSLTRVYLTDEFKIVDRHDRPYFDRSFRTRARRARNESNYLVQVSGFDDGKPGKRRLGIGEGTICGGRLAIPGTDGGHRRLNCRHESSPLPHHLVLREHLVLFLLGQDIPVFLVSIGQTQVFHRFLSIVGLKARVIRFCKCYGFKSSDALPVFGSKGTELCSCVTIHFPSILRKQRVVRHHISSFPPSVFVALTWLIP